MEYDKIIWEQQLWPNKTLIVWFGLFDFCLVWSGLILKQVLCSTGWPRTYYVVQTDLKFAAVFSLCIPGAEILDVCPHAQLHISQFWGSPLPVFIPERSTK